MSFSFRPAGAFTDRHGVFVAVVGPTNCGKSFSALRLARGIAGPKGKIAAIDTEGGRLLHLKRHFEFDINLMDPPYRPERFAEAAKAAEDAGYAALLMDSFSMEWVGMGGVLDWQAEEFQRMGARDAMKLASWIKPKMGHKAMVYSFLQRRIPIIFSLRAEEKAKKVGSEIKTEWAPICNKSFPFEVTVSFMLMQDRQGVIDLSKPHKMEGDHRQIFRDGEQLSERHGEQLAAWACGAGAAAATQQTQRDPDLAAHAVQAAERGTAAYRTFWTGITNEQRAALQAGHEGRKAIAAAADEPDDDAGDGLPVVTVPLADDGSSDWAGWQASAEAGLQTVDQARVEELWAKIEPQRKQAFKNEAGQVALAAVTRAYEGARRAAAA